MSAGYSFTCFLALTVLGSCVCPSVPEKSSAIVCNEGSLKEIERLISKVPLKVSNAIRDCLQESVPQINEENSEVKCSTGTVYIPKKIHGVVFHTLEFAACGSKVVKNQQAELTDSEKKVIEEVQMSGLKLLDQASKDE